MTDAKKLVFLRVSEGDVEAFIADIPDKDDIKKLSFRGPFIIAPKQKGDLPFGLEAGPAVYDFHNEEIVWACHGGPPARENAYYFVNVWRIGSHFALVAVERTPLQTGRDAMSFRPSVMVDGGKLSVGGLNTPFNQPFFPLLARRSRDTPNQSTQRLNGPFLRDTGVNPIYPTSRDRDAIGRYYDWDSNVVQSPQDPWIPLPFHSAKPSDGKNYPLLFRPARDDLKYIFFFRQGHGEETALFVDTIKASKYAELYYDGPIQWQNFKVDMGFPLRANIASIILSDHKAKINRLYIFHAHHNNQVIDYAYIPLRKDGSIDSYEASLTALEKQTLRVALKPSSTALHVQQSHDRLLLTWNESDSPAAVNCYTGLLTEGHPPSESGWAKVELEFTKAPLNNSSPVAYHSCIVPSDFE